MNRHALIHVALLFIAAAHMILVAPRICSAAEHRAASATDVTRLDAALRPGDTLLLEDGVWADQRLRVTAAGTPEQPITIRPRTSGAAKFTGSSSITLAGEHLVLSGVRFQDFTPATESAAIAVTGTHCRVTECALEDGTSKFYVHLIGPENRLDRCYLAGKTSDDPTVQVEVRAERPNRTRIDHNHFGNRPPLGRNGGETLRVGYSHQGPNISGLVCESNLFEHCDGELEIISNKSSENVYRYNTFLESAGTLTLRHGDRCVVDANIFLGRNKPHTGAIRVLGEGQIVTNNYIEGVAETPILITAGVTDPEPKDHAQARNCLIAHNTIAESKTPYLALAAGLNSIPRRSLKPAHITLANNVFSLPTRARLTTGPEGEDFRWFGNFLEVPDAEAATQPAAAEEMEKDRSGVKRARLKLMRGVDGLQRPSPDSPVRGAAVSGDADALFAAGTAAHFDTDIDGQPRRVPSDAGCDEVSDEPVQNGPLTPADVGPKWLPRGKRPGVIASTQIGAASAPAGRSEWVSLSDAGKLTYKQLPAGDRIMDFSSAGYRGGGVAIPQVKVARTVASPPEGGEDDEVDHTADIQQAIDAVSALPLVNGVRGAVLLEPGLYRCGHTLTIRAAGVVLRGSGSDKDGTLIELTRRPHLAIRVRAEARLTMAGDTVDITDRYVPAGSDSLTVSDAGKLKPGDDVIIHRPVTPAWVRFMGMDSLTRNGERQLWVKQDEIRTPRRVRAVDGKRITLEVPLSDSIDAKYLKPPGATLTRLNKRPEHITEVGIESLRMRAPAALVSIDQPLFRAVEMDAVADAWMRDVAIEDTVNSIFLGGDTARVTLERVRITHRVATLGSAKPADITLSGTQTLVDRCESSANSIFQLTTNARMVGPNVALNCTFGGDGRVQPHQRWATGLLLDNCAAPDGGIDFMNRGSMGSGHGWTIGWGVAWNCAAKSMLIQAPPGATNWAIGCTGELQDRPQPFGKSGVDPNMPRGTIDSHGTRVSPKSLYLAQLRERLGPKALDAIGYTEEDAR